MIKKLTVNYQNGTTGIEFFDCTAGMEDIDARMEMLDFYKTEYKIEDSSRKEWNEYNNAQLEIKRKETEEYRQINGTTFTMDDLMKN